MQVIKANILYFCSVNEKNSSNIGELNISHWQILSLAIVFSWIIWCVVNYQVFKLLSGWPLVCELLKEFAEQILETTILLELSILYIKGIVQLFWERKKTIGNLLVQVILLAVFNGFSSIIFGQLYSLIYPEKEHLFAKIAYTDYLNLSVLTTAYMVVFLMRQYKTEREARLEATLKNLSLQTNNHFIFNSFSTLSGLIETDPVKAAEFNRGLVYIYRYLITNGAKTIVHIKEELSFVKEYTLIAQCRYPNISIKIDEALEKLDCYVCPVALQSLVENAIKHNRHGKKSHLIITLHREDNYIVVANNILPRQDTVHGTGNGIKVIAARYSMLSDIKVVIKNDASVFKVFVPILYLEDFKDESIDY